MLGLLRFLFFSLQARPSNFEQVYLDIQIGLVAPGEIGEWMARTAGCPGRTTFGPKSYAARNARRESDWADDVDL